MYERKFYFNIFLHIFITHCPINQHIMKSSFKFILALLICAGALVYVGCKKTANLPAVKTNSNVKSISAQIALNLYASITGKFGGANISDGIKAPSSLSHRGPVINSLNSLCGFIIDTVYNSTVPGVDTTKKFTGEFKFTYNCSTSSVDGYTVYDSLKNIATGAAFMDTALMVQSYLVKATDPTFKAFSINGYIKSYIDNVVPGPPAQFNLLSSLYSLSALTVDNSGSTADVTGGTATFNTTAKSQNSSGGPSTATYTGTIVFLGNHMATLTINTGGNTYVYTANLLTGVLS